MSFLLAKILLILLLAALFGAWFGYWWVRRQYEDVTSEYSRQRSDWLSWRKGFEEKLAAKPDVDLKPLAARIDDLPAAVRGILFPFQDRLASLEDAVTAIKIPAPKDLDLGPVTTRMEALEGAVRGIRMPTLPVMPMVDLGPTQERLESLERAVKAIVIPPPPVIPAAQAVDLQPVYGRLAELEAAIRAWRAELRPVLDQLDALRKAPVPATAPTPTPTSTPTPVVTPNAGAPAASAVVRSGSRNLLAHAAFGAPDDLKLIKGVARVMERMLHDIGVYYFWQIAEWTPTDVAHADAQLTAFRGRIERDHWVLQALEFADRPQSARKPDTI